jgi:hypothetical protein
MVEAFVNIGALPVLSVVERNFFAMGQQTSVKGAVVALKLLLLSGEYAEGRRNLLDNKSGKAVPGKNKGGTLPAYQLG